MASGASHFKGAQFKESQANLFMANTQTGTTDVNPRVGFEGDEDFASMLEESFKGKGTTKGGELKENEIVHGTIVQVTKEYAVVDIGYKSEGQVPIQEFGLVDGKPNVKVGDTVDVLLESREGREYTLDVGRRDARPVVSDLDGDVPFDATGGDQVLAHHCGEVRLPAVED